MLQAETDVGGRIGNIVGLEDGGHIILSCMACRKKLVDIWITLPKAIDPKTHKVFHWRVQASCCYCGDKSFVREFDGKFHVGGYGENKPDDPEQDIARTAISETLEMKDRILFHTVKA
jgi:hypothetical protein